ncbi:MAG: MBL fold metallo-hydrolase [Bryobacteraceae bacterium]
MRKQIIIAGSVLCIAAGLLLAQSIAPKAPFSAADAEKGKVVNDESLRIRAQIKNMRDPAEGFKIMGNLFFVGVANGEVYLLTSPKGHILFGAAFPDTVDQIQKNVEAVGFKMTDIKAILLNHNHNDQSGGAMEIKRRSGGTAQIMTGFAEVPFMEHGGALPPGTGIPNMDPGRPGGGGYPPIHVDRSLFDGDVIEVGPLKVTAYLAPGHSASPTSWSYYVKEGSKNYHVVEFCCWEYPEDITRNQYITEASVRHNLELFRKLLPVDIYLETGAYGWSGTLNQSSGTILERMAKLKQDHMLFVNPDIYKQWSAAREVEFEEKIAKLKAAGHPLYK